MKTGSFVFHVIKICFDISKLSFEYTSSYPECFLTYNDIC
jgi:hypothetical protein